MAVNKVKGLLGCSEWDGNREVEISFEESMSTEHSNFRHDEGSTLLPYQARALCVNKHRPELVDRACLSCHVLGPPPPRLANTADSR